MVEIRKIIRRERSFFPSSGLKRRDPWCMPWAWRSSATPSPDISSTTCGRCSRQGLCSAGD